MASSASSSNAVAAEAEEQPRTDAPASAPDAPASAPPPSSPRATIGTPSPKESYHAALVHSVLARVTAPSTDDQAAPVAASD